VSANIASSGDDVAVPGEPVTVRLRRFALTLPGAWEDFPWDEPVAKVGKKIFAFLSDHAAGPSLTVKLGESHEAAMALPGSIPSRYGLGRAGWVTTTLDGAGVAPVAVLEDWIDESYRLVAPKHLVRELDERGRTQPASSTRRSRE
jgi:predicted DNA-binding protein (MmcQ/YjbR family)